ncbi:tellurite resistance protein TerB [uncultured Porphyromonas sp.]|jgi:hypothetical protein|uniref:tellurite resistance protein TerB n=1 Tax=uncultured Porphyromonas sp. TaxID=159274 RepID=UPI0028044649|nr:tellurite resistance protein TerB [uncultured Porphyromonas sp.]
MKLNEQELCAVIKMAKAMTMADGSIDLSEVKVLRKELMRLGVPDSNVESVLEKADVLTPAGALFSIAAMDEEKKRYVAALLGTILIIDGDVDDDELKLWRFTSEICSLPTMSIGEAVLYLDNWA